MEANFDINILNLVQHVELNKAGWWDYVIQRLILATLWMEGKFDSMPLNKLVEAIHFHFELRLGGKLESVVYQMIKAGELIKLTDGSIKLSETSARELISDIHDAEEIINRAKKVFIETIVYDGIAPADKEKIWINFNDTFLRPFIKDVGANIYELLNGLSVNIDQSILDNFLSDYPIEQRGCINNSVKGFLNSKDQYARSYILRSLNAYFCIEAGSLDKTTLDTLQNSLAQQHDFILFIDTNFLFSILELHENPSNVAAIGLIELITHLDGKINLKLFVLNQTLQEARAVLLATIDSLNGSRVTPNMAAAASRFVSGLSRKFYIEINRSEIPLTPKEYFQPYIDNLALILLKKGVEIFNEETTSLNTRQDVVDDILEQSEFEEQKYGERAKSYKPLEHDIVLWHFVKDKRKVGVDSILDAGYWIVTIDYRFLGFDEYRKMNDVITVPICLHPTTLVQLLQFWIPRSQLLEDTLFSSLWLPFVFRDLDPQAENITIEIVKTLGRFENIGDLSKETIIEVLVNDALRQKIKNEPDINKQIELVREVLIEQNQIAKAEAEAVKLKNIEYERKLQKKDSDLARLRGDLQKTKEDFEQEKASRENLSEEFRSFKASLGEKEKTVLAKSTKQKFINRGLVLPTIVIVLIWILIIFIFPEYIKIAGVISGIVLIAWAWMFDYFGKGNPIITEIPMFRKYHSAIKWILSVLGIIIIGLIQNGLYDLVKGLFNK
ncbi:MAG: hypothetical protein WC837_01165 [Bellilinea sp.]